MASTSPVHKRPKLDPSASPSPPPASVAQRVAEESIFPDAGRKSDRSISLDVDGEEDEDHCVICLHPISDRTVLPCAHDRLCFDCIFVWCQQSRKCPLCNAPIGPFLIHNFRTKYDYSKYFLPPLRISSPTSAPVLGPLSEHASAHPRSRGRARGRSNRWGSRRQNGSASRERRETADELELAIERRRWVYRHDLYAKHVASNPYTRYRPAPTPPQIAASPDLISRATIFVRRELRVWVNLDVEFLTTFILSLMKTLDLRSESAVKLLAEFLDMDTPYYVGDLQEPSAGRFANAERFSHELYSYLRSPFRDLAAYDAVVQYETPPPPAEPLRDTVEQHRRHIPAVPSPRRNPPHSPPPSRSHAQRNSHPRSPSPARRHTQRVPWSRRLHTSKPGSTTARQGSPKNSPANNTSAPDAGGSDTKGKGKVTFPSNSGDDDRRHYNQPTDRPGSDMDRATRPAGPSDDLPVPRDLPPYTSSASSDAVRRDVNARSARAESPSASVPPLEEDEKVTPVPNSRRPVTGDDDDITREAASLVEDGQDLKKEKVDADRSETVTAGGISIKGQAKRLGQRRERTPTEAPSDSYREPRLAEAKSGPGHGQSTVPRKRARHPPSLDMLRVHLADSAPPRQDITRATPTATTKIEAVEGPAGLTRVHGDGVPSDETPPENPTSSLGPSASSRKSARDIMARTRAKLAKLSASGAELSQTPVGGVIVISDTPSASASASASAHPDAPAAGATSRVSPSAADLRSRLMARLKEEKRHATLCSDETPAENPTSSLGPGASSSKSARDIMARTRAKLAKLSASGAEPSQTPVGGVIVLSDTPSASASAHPDAPAAGATSRVSPSTADLRSRLMARLAEEKRHATASGVQPSPPRDRDQAPLTKETPGIGIDATKGSSTPETTKMSISISSQAQQAEAKLRAQALLRVRLAAEKRRADVGPGLREEALRARLLSRRTT